MLLIAHSDQPAMLRVIPDPLCNVASNLCTVTIFRFAINRSDDRKICKTMTTNPHVIILQAFANDADACLCM